MSIVDFETIKNIRLDTLDGANPELGRQFRNALQFINSEYGKNRLARIEEVIEQAKTGMIFELTNDNVEGARQNAALITGLEEAKKILFAEVIYEAEAESHIAISTMEEDNE